MKKIVFLLLLLQIVSAGSSQNSRERFLRLNAAPVTREKVNTAQHIRDVIGKYPSHWDNIIDIISVKLEGKVKDKEISAEGSDLTLTEDQKNILDDCEQGTVVTIRISFRWKDTTTALGDYGKVQQMNEYRVAIVPEVEAEFAGGLTSLSQYLEDNVYKKARDLKGVKKLWAHEGEFTIDEEGSVVNDKIFTRSENPGIDQLYRDAIRNMPRWTPARAADGVRVKQVFRFSLPVPGEKEAYTGTNRKSGC